MHKALTHQAKIEKTSSYNLPCPLFRKEGNSPPFSKGRWGGIISGVYTIMDSLVSLTPSPKSDTEIRPREGLSMTRPEPAPPIGFLTIPELIEDLRSFLRSGLQSNDLLYPLLTSAYSLGMLPYQALQG